MSCDIEATIDQRPIDVEVQGAIVAMDLADGDYGDIAVSNNGATMTIENMGENATVTTGTYVSKVNQDLLIKVRKASAGTITKGQAVYIVGSTGNHLTVELARADAEVTSAYTIGIAATTITNTTDGFVIQNGRLTGLSTVSTTTFADGDAIYLSETTAGAYRVGLPQAPNHGVFLGFVIKANNGNAGEIDIRIDNYQELEELSDVYINNEITNDFLVRKATRWENTTPANVKTILAIDNVDNTSDANKPISTATQTALNAKVNKNGDTMTGALVNSTNGAVSTPPMSLTGSWYNGGTSTTTKPQVLIEPTGTTSNTWSTAGTGLGVNAPSGFTGNLATFGINGTERMRITASGNVGIGTTSPGVLLEVNGAMTAQGNIFAASGGATRTITLGPAGAGLEYNIDGTTYLGGRTDAYPLVFRTNSAERMRISSTGNVGIGTNNPSGLLHLEGGSGATGVQLFVSTITGYAAPAAGNAALSGGAKIVLWNDTYTPQKASIGMDESADIWFNNAGGQAGSGFTFYTGNGASATPAARLKIAKNGNVGIGTTNPADVLHINGGYIRIQRDTPQILFRSADGASNQYYIGANISDVVDGGFVIGEGANLSSGTPRITINGAGNVGIGTATPAALLDVNGTIQTTANGAVSTPPMSLTGSWYSGGTSTNTKPQLLIEPAGTTSTSWSTAGTGLGVNAPSGFTGNLLDLQVNGTPQVRISSTGAIAFQPATTNNLISPTAFANALLLQTDIEPLYVLPCRSAQGSPKFSFCHISNAGRTPGFNISSDHSVNWNNGIDISTGSADLRLFRDAANTLAQRNGTNAQTYRIYNTFTSSTNFERLNIRWTSNEAIIDTEAGSGGGTLRGLRIGSAATSLLGFYTATPVAQPAAVADATDAASVITQLNLLLARMRTLGLIAT